VTPLKEGIWLKHVETRCITEGSLGMCVATVLTRISFFGRRYH